MGTLPVYKNFQNKATRQGAICLFCAEHITVSLSVILCGTAEVDHSRKNRHFVEKELFPRYRWGPSEGGPGNCLFPASTSSHVVWFTLPNLWGEVTWINAVWAEPYGNKRGGAPRKSPSTTPRFAMRNMGGATAEALHLALAPPPPKGCAKGMQEAHGLGREQWQS